jgi:hypothetical protein
MPAIKKLLTQTSAATSMAFRTPSFSSRWRVGHLVSVGDEVAAQVANFSWDSLFF